MTSHFYKRACLLPCTASAIADAVLTDDRCVVLFGPPGIGKSTLAGHAHTLFLEATFAEADVQHAIDNGHLTTRACGEIAEAAGVSRLVPFHLPQRYADDPQVPFDELLAACPRVLLPNPALLVPSPADPAPGVASTPAVALR